MSGNIPLIPKVTLVLGAARSGKSSRAQQMAETQTRPLYLATAETLDPEMAERVAAHRKSRGERWLCVEEPLDIHAVIANPPTEADVILLDCITLWLSNILHKEGLDALPGRRTALLNALRETTVPVVLVSNEVGMGIVPDNKLGRQFRDAAGWLNQDLAAAADLVLLVVAGIPLAIKGCLPSIFPSAGGR